MHQIYIFVVDKFDTKKIMVQWLKTWILKVKVRGSSHLQPK
jgi:hypothetical protein